VPRGAGGASSYEGTAQPERMCWGKEYAVNPSRWLETKSLLALLCLGILGVLFHFNWDGWSFCDEMENLYDSYLVAHGWLPYRDYWRTHFPGVELLLAPLFLILQPPASNYQLYFVGRFLVLTLHILAQVYLLHQLFRYTEPGEHFERTFRSRLPWYAVVALVSYIISPILMTNLVWSESFLYCYLLFSVGFFLRWVHGQARWVETLFFGIMSGISIAASAIAAPIVLCILLFCWISPLASRGRGWPRHVFHSACLLGGTCVPLICVGLLAVVKIGWEETWFQAWTVPTRYQAITAFGQAGLLGAALKPLEYILACLRVVDLMPKYPLILSFRFQKEESCLVIVMCLIVGNYVLLKTKPGFPVWRFVVFLAALLYSSLVRGQAFHIGFGFHCAFTLAVAWLILLRERRVSFDVSASQKVLLLLPILASFNLFVNGCRLQCVYLGAYVQRPGSPTRKDAAIATFAVRKLLAAHDDVQGERHRIWIPGFRPHVLYYTGLFPADKVYMALPLHGSDPYVRAAYERIVSEESILVLPINDSRGMPLAVGKSMAEKLERQSAYIPVDISDVNAAGRWKEQHVHDGAEYVAVRSMDRTVGSGLRLTGLARRGYKYSFFLVHETGASTDMEFVIRLRPENGGIPYFKSIPVAGPTWQEAKLRIDWEMEDNNIGSGEFSLGISALIRPTTDPPQVRKQDPNSIQFVEPLDLVQI
jgi:hypothetical protein